MATITLGDKTFRPFIPYAKLEESFDILAARINADYAGGTDIPVVLCTLTGAIMFTAEMLKRLDFNLEVISVKLSSYQGVNSTGTVLTTMGMTGDVKGRRVIVFEDIVDTGTTVVALRDMLLGQGAKDVRICTMLFKPASYDKSVGIDYVGLEIPPAFIVGFGLDYNELGRNLKDIYVIDK